jgi:enamine deaminase RidA (YjgF/YER057c/UK114 family)
MDAIAVSTIINTIGVNYLMPKNLTSGSDVVQSAILPAGPVVYVSGQAVKGELAEATRGTLEQLQATLVSLGLEKKHIVQIKSFIRPMSDLKVVEKEFAQFFKGNTIPPMVNVEWTSKDPVIEIELIASSPNRGAQPAQQLDFITPAGMTASPVYCKVTRINYGQKIFEVSHWGNVAIEERYQVENVGAKLEGEFGRVDYDNHGRHGGMNAMKKLRAKLPLRSNGLWYRDEIGNISTSRAVRNVTYIYLYIYYYYHFFIFSGMMLD